MTYRSLLSDSEPLKDALPWRDALDERGRPSPPTAVGELEHPEEPARHRTVGHVPQNRCVGPGKNHCCLREPNMPNRRGLPCGSGRSLTRTYQSPQPFHRGCQRMTAATGAP